MATLGPFKVPTAGDGLLVVAEPEPNLAYAPWIFCDASFEVDWGDGTWVNYPAGSASQMPVGTVTMRSNSGATWFGLNYGFISIDVVSMDGITSLASAFADNPQLVSMSIPSTAAITDFRGAWSDCSSLTSFPLIDTSAGTDLSHAWSGCSSLTSFPQIDTSAATNLRNAWSSCSSLTSFPLLDTSAATDLSSAWRWCSSLTSFPLLDTSAATDLSYAWGRCSSLTSFPQIDTSAATNLRGAWSSCSSLASFPQIDTSAATDLSYAWSGCSSLTSFPLLDTSAATNLRGAWSSCSSLTSFPLLDTSAATDFMGAWNGCSSLTSFPLLDTSAATDLSYAWANCSNLATIPPINTASVTDFTNMLANSGVTRLPAFDYSSAISMGGMAYSERLVCVDYLDTTGVDAANRVNVLRKNGCIRDPSPDIVDQLMSASGAAYTSSGSVSCSPFCGSGYLILASDPGIFQFHDTLKWEFPYQGAGNEFWPVLFGLDPGQTDIAGFGSPTGWINLSPGNWHKILYDDGAGNTLVARIEGPTSPASGSGPPVQVYSLRETGSADMQDILGIYNTRQDICISGLIN